MSKWVTLDCERALYVDRGRDTILCDRLPSPITLVVKLASAMSAGTAETQSGSGRKPASAETPK
jgi:hypothetical protein